MFCELWIPPCWLPAGSSTDAGFYTCHEVHWKRYLHFLSNLSGKASAVFCTGYGRFLWKGAIPVQDLHTPAAEPALRGRLNPQLCSS